MRLLHLTLPPILLPFAILMATLPPESHRLKADHLPTPFSAEEIRAASPPGHVTRFLTLQPGQEPIVMVTTFLEGPEGKATFRIEYLNETGEPVQPAHEGTTTWEELQNHASYPAAETTVEEATIEIEGTSYSCWFYNRTQTQEQNTVITKAYFSKDHPGPPIKMVMTLNDQPLFEMTLIP